MATMELSSSLLKEVASIMGNEEAMKDVVKYIRRLRREMKSKVEAKPKLQPYTIEELHARIAESEADEEAGREYTSEEVHEIMLKEFPWLCK